MSSPYDMLLEVVSRKAVVYPQLGQVITARDVSKIICVEHMLHELHCDRDMLGWSTPSSLAYSVMMPARRVFELCITCDSGQGALELSATRGLVRHGARTYARWYGATIRSKSASRSGDSMNSISRCSFAALRWASSPSLYRCRFPDAAAAHFRSLSTRFAISGRARRRSAILARISCTCSANGSLESASGRFRHTAAGLRRSVWNMAVRGFAGVHYAI